MSQGAILIEDRPTGEAAELAREFEKWLRFYVPLMGLSDWIIEIQYGSLSEDSEGYTIECLPQWHYKRARMVVDLSSKELAREGQMPRFARHELFHLVLNTITDPVGFLAPEAALKLLDQLEESVTTHLENMPLWDKIGGPDG